MIVFVLLLENRVKVPEVYSTLHVVVRRHQNTEPELVMKVFRDFIFLFVVLSLLAQ